MRLKRMIFPAAVIALLLCACAVPGRGPEPGRDREDVQTPAELAADQSEKNSDDLYGIFLMELSAGAKEIVLRDVEPETAAKAYLSVRQEHPELFWLQDGYSWQQISGVGGSTLTFTPALDSDPAALPEKRQALEAALQVLCASAEGLSTEYDRALAIHDRLVADTEYDRELFARIRAAGDEFISSDSLNAYGCLVQHRAVCSGYAAAFQLAMQRLGIECGRTAGTGLRGEPHEWNWVRLDGALYWVDVTWDDPVTEGEPLPLISREFFCIGDGELYLTRTLGEGEEPPVCGAEGGDFFARNGLLFDGYDPAAIGAVPLNEYGAAQIKFTSAETAEEAVKRLFGEGEIFDIFGVRGTAVYSVGESGTVLSIAFPGEG